MSHMNHSRFPSTPPPVLYNTKIHIMPARIILNICKPDALSLIYYLKSKTMAEVINTFLNNKILTDQNSLTHLLDFDEESDNSINSIEPSLYYTMTNFINTYLQNSTNQSRFSVFRKHGLKILT